MTHEFIVPNDGGWHRAHIGPCRIQLFGRVYAHYSGTAPTAASVGHVEDNNIAYPGGASVYLKVFEPAEDRDVRCVVTGV